MKGFDTIRKKYFCYVCRNVVLANGTYDDRNLLNIPEELDHPDWIFHDLKQFRSAVVDLKKSHSGGYWLMRELKIDFLDDLS